MAYPKLTKALFHGYKTSLWLLLSTVYFIWWILYSKPALFSSLYFSWFFNPYVGYRLDPDGTVRNLKFFGTSAIYEMEVKKDVDDDDEEE
jgi:hypothetical protein